MGGSLSALCQIFLGSHQLFPYSPQHHERNNAAVAVTVAVANPRAEHHRTRRPMPLPYLRAHSNLASLALRRVSYPAPNPASDPATPAMF